MPLLAELAEGSALGSWQTQLKFFAPSPRGQMGSALCSTPAAVQCPRHLPCFPSGQWIFPVPRLSLCLPLCSALGSPPVPAVPRVLPCSTQSIQQFPWWQAAQEPELE